MLPNTFEQIARQLEDFDKRLEHLERLEAGEGGYTEGARVYKDSDTTLPTAVTTYIAFNQERWDTDGIHSVVVNTTRLTAQTAGVYSIMGAIRFDPNNNGNRNVAIRLNGVTFIGINRMRAATGDSTAVTVATQYDLAISDYVELGCLQTSGGNLDVTATPNWSPEFMMQRIG